MELLAANLPSAMSFALLLCLLLFSWFPSCHRRVSSCLCGYLTPQIQELRKARGERALWRVLTRADLSSQIEAPVGVEPTMADLQFLAHHARDVLRIASPASLTGLLLFLLLCSCGRRCRTT